MPAPPEDALPHRAHIRPLFEAATPPPAISLDRVGAPPLIRSPRVAGCSRRYAKYAEAARQRDAALAERDATAENLHALLAELQAKAPRIAELKTQHDRLAADHQQMALILDKANSQVMRGATDEYCLRRTHAPRPKPRPTRATPKATPNPRPPPTRAAADAAPSSPHATVWQGGALESRCHALEQQLDSKEALLHGLDRELADKTLQARPRSPHPALPSPLARLSLAPLSLAPRAPPPRQPSLAPAARQPHAPTAAPPPAPPCSDLRSRPALARAPPVCHAAQLQLVLDQSQKQAVAVGGATPRRASLQPTFGAVPRDALSPGFGLSPAPPEGGPTPQDVIERHLVPFRDIAELTTKNAQLLRTVRALSEAHEAEIAQKESEQDTAVSAALAEVETLRQTSRRQQQKLEELATQRDVYKSLRAPGGAAGSPLAAGSPADTAMALIEAGGGAEAEAALEALREELAAVKQHATETEADLSAHVERARAAEREARLKAAELEAHATMYVTKLQTLEASKASGGDELSKARQDHAALSSQLVELQAMLRLRS